MPRFPARVAHGTGGDVGQIVLLGIAVVLVLAAVFSGSKPDSARSIRGTRMMTAGRVVLVVIALVLAFFGIYPWL